MHSGPVLVKTMLGPECNDTQEVFRLERVFHLAEQFWSWFTLHEGSRHGIVGLWQADFLGLLLFLMSLVKNI